MDQPPVPDILQETNCYVHNLFHALTLEEGVGCETHYNWTNVKKKVDTKLFPTGVILTGCPKVTSLWLHSCSSETLPYIHHTIRRNDNDGLQKLLELLSTIFNAHFTPSNHRFINKVVFAWNVNTILVPQLLEQPVFVTRCKEGMIRRLAANGHHIYNK